MSGISDPRFRMLSSESRTDHFDALQQQLDSRIGKEWVLGGDINGITKDEQSYWGSYDPLNFTSADVSLSMRRFMDRRPTMTTDVVFCVFCSAEV